MIYFGIPPFEDLFRRRKGVWGKFYSISFLNNSFGNWIETI